MRLLAIDIGNSRIKCALFQGSEIEHAFEMASDRLASGAAYRHSLRAHVRELGPQRAAIASVVPELNERVGEAVKRELMILPEFVTAADVPPRMVAYESPSTLGADRIAAAVAGHHFYGSGPDGARPVIVIDAGTAITFEVIDAGGTYLGGAIWAGPKLVAASLAAGTSLLPEVELIPPRQAVGADTEACLRSGVLFGFLDGVAGILGRLQRKTGSQTFTVATGGLGAWLADRLGSIDSHEPHLVLHGIRLIASRLLA